MKGIEADDSTLLARWRAGDARAGNQLFDHHFTALYRFFHHKVGGDAADLVQRTFLVCVEGRDRFREEASFRTFLFGIARNVLFAHLRANRRYAAEDVGASSLEDLGSSVGSVLDRHREERRLLEALHAIPLDLQIALELHYWEGLTGPELASVLDVPEGTVRSRLRRAREAVAERMRSMAVASERTVPGADDVEAWAASLARLRAALALE